MTSFTFATMFWAHFNLRRSKDALEAVGKAVHRPHWVIGGDIFCL